MLIHEISMKKRKVLDRIYRLVLIVVTILIDVGVFMIESLKSKEK